jgi:hypothetical protein
MTPRQRHKETRRSGRQGIALELHLSHTAFVTGKRLSGVVVFRLARPTSIKALTVTVSGRETPSGASLARALRGTSSFFGREVLLSGMEPPRLTSERVSQLWNAFLGRDKGRTLSPGEHTYPFSITLPASLPPSYEGKAGRIGYSVTARAQFPLGGGLRVSADVPVVSAPRTQRSRPIAISYPTEGGTVHAGEVSVNLELPRRSVELGGVIRGHITINNPRRAEISGATVSLETCEWVRLSSDKELQRTRADSAGIRPEDPTAEVIQSDFELTVPADGVPSVEGTAISVIWLLKLSIDTSPPLELKTPIAVYAPLPDETAGTGGWADESTN